MTFVSPAAAFHSEVGATAIAGALVSINQCRRLRQIYPLHTPRRLIHRQKGDLAAKGRFSIIRFISGLHIYAYMRYTHSYYAAVIYR